MTYLGLLEIGQQIESPFNYDQSDLDLDGLVGKLTGKLTGQLAQVTAFPSSVPTSHVVMSNLNQPFLPTLSLSAPEFMGIPAVSPSPTTMGFAATFPQSLEGDDTPTLITRPLARSMRNIEHALNANWKEISSQTHRSDWQNHQEFENKTGVDVAVLAL